MADRKKELATAIQQTAETQGFEGALNIIKENKDALNSDLQAIGVREILKKATKDRLLLSFVNAVGFGVRPLADSLARLDRLMSYKEGTYVLSAAWGIGVVRGMDDFYHRVKVDFKSRKGHQFTFDAACETLSVAPKDHILVQAFTAEGAKAVVEMAGKQPGEFVKAMLKSFGDMPVARLEDLCVKHGFVGAGGWKAFWERAREALKGDKEGDVVEIPTRRTEPLHLKAGGENHGDGWFDAFMKDRDPKSILTAVKEYESAFKAAGKGSEGKFADRLPSKDRDRLANRLNFALMGVRGVDDALYARIAVYIAETGLDIPGDSEFSSSLRYLWEGNRYLAAARSMPARDVGNLVGFLVGAVGEDAKRKLFAAIPDMCFNLLAETLKFFADDEECGNVVAELLKDPHPPATVVACVLGRYDSFKKWAAIPSLATMMHHAIALGEGRQAGETLKMQNTVRRLFANPDWLKDTMAQLGPDEKVQVFERFQASTAWDPATHRAIIVRMSKSDPDVLASHLVRRTEQRAPERVTSQRSYNERKAAYERLVNVEMPENTRRIEFARGYGDLSENAEYQYAKDEQRALLQKQSLMQKELDEVKPTLFEGVEADEVRMGTSAVVSVDGSERTLVVLGEWDNDPSLNIISSGTKLAMNLLGRKPGDSVELADADGNAVSATLLRVEPINDDVKAWIRG